ncbi:PLP-dependent transferase [Sulfidibacter corallicola]|uniref:PLP-dependent transferase n=1 Tax=Sulfidibacter corallicola TaxID=2818388 RepID=A0A8A4TH96_SULCO|nr:PLP-dependent transferase [Sulfidibacter corallicola]QTD48181.1 PLP-dependent transferase [Sulfidibacter corallicola]
MTPVVTQTHMPETTDFDAAKILSPLRKTSSAQSVQQLADEQLAHFGIAPDSEFGQTLHRAATSLYDLHMDVQRMWELTTRTLKDLDRGDRVAYFNAKKFLCFQLAKVLDTLQNPFRKTYQSLEFGESSTYAKGPYPIFDNVTALFSANPVIVRTATYIYACTEWVDDAFQGREFLHEIYSRLLNPTSISLANYVVDVEAGPHAAEYLAWNFNSGMAAIDGLLGHLLQTGDILIASRNVYGGVYQLLHDYYARPEKLNVALEWFDGTTTAEFEAFLGDVRARHDQALEQGRRLYVYLESPCNPFGYVLDIPGICKAAHAHDHLVIHDATVGTPFLHKPLQRPDKAERPDFVVHSYTKDLTGNGNATAGVVIGENHRMFQPKGDCSQGVSWDKTLFWGVYYIKGAFLDAEKAFEVISGMKTLELRMKQKCINTLILARYLNSHPEIQVNCNAVSEHFNHELCQKVMRFGLPAPLFTIDFEAADLPRDAFVRFFDSLTPGLDHQVSLGQSNTVVLCPALTSHSEMKEEALRKAGIAPTTIRIAVGLENPKETLSHLIHALRLGVDPIRPGFSARFMTPEDTDRMVREIHEDVHRLFLDDAASMEALLS